MVAIATSYQSTGNRGERIIVGNVSSHKPIALWGSGIPGRVCPRGRRGSVCVRGSAGGGVVAVIRVVVLCGGVVVASDQCVRGRGLLGAFRIYSA